MNEIQLHPNIHFDIHVEKILKLCSQLIYCTYIVQKLLRDQGLPHYHINFLKLKFYPV